MIKKIISIIMMIITFFVPAKKEIYSSVKKQVQMKEKKSDQKKEVKKNDKETEDKSGKASERATEDTAQSTEKAEITRTEKRKEKKETKFRTTKDCLSKSTREVISQITGTNESKIRIPVNDQRPFYELRDYLCSSFYLSLCRDKDTKELFIKVSNVSKVKNRLNRVESHDRELLKQVIAYYKGDNEETLEAFGNYLCNCYSYKYSVDNPFQKGEGGNCNVYAANLKRMCDMCNIPCELIAGYPSSGEGHAWNRVRINGIWYWSDICWYDNPDSSKYLKSINLWDDHRCFRNSMNKYISLSY